MVHSIYHTMCINTHPAMAIGNMAMRNRKKMNELQWKQILGTDLFWGVCVLKKHILPRALPKGPKNLKSKIASGYMPKNGTLLYVYKYTVWPLWGIRNQLFTSLLVGELIYSFTGHFVDLSTGSIANCLLDGHVVHWSTGWMINWLVQWSVALFIGQLVY